MFRLSTNSSNINIFIQSKHDYEMALKNSGYKTKLICKPMDVRNRWNNRAKKIS